MANQNVLPGTLYMDGEFRRVGPTTDDLVFIAGVAIIVATFDDIFSASAPEGDKDTVRRQQGDSEEVTGQFDAAVDPASAENRDGVKVGRDKKTGRTLVLRARSTDRGGSEATLEEQRITEQGRTRSRKVRFDPPNDEKK